MKLSQFAHELLSSPSLDGKLLRPEQIDFDEATHSFSWQGYPDRPEEFAFAKNNKTEKNKSTFPKNLGETSERAKIFHFFMNHELLAIELMALTLLKFPEAPLNFRRGLYETILEEQEHCRLYQERMLALNEGAMPAIHCSPFFWDSLKGISKIEEYLAGMSLTFEQANLDFALYYHQQMIGLDDDASAKALKTVYLDEIGHVKFGVQMMKNLQPEKTLWQSYLEHLRFPLDPIRAKAQFYFDLEGRKLAGFDDSFIQSMQTHQFSRGRPAQVFIFNPEAEAQIQRELPLTLDMSRRAQDLAPILLGKLHHEDILYHSQADQEHWQKLKNLGLNLASMKSATELRTKHKTFQNQKLGFWAHPPTIHEQCLNFVKEKPLGMDKGIWLRSEHWQTLQNSKSALKVSSPTILNSLADLQKFCAKKGKQKLVLKRDISCSGQGILIREADELNSMTESDWQKFTRGEKIIGEDFRKIHKEVSAQFQIVNDRVKFVCLNECASNHLGQFSASRAGKFKSLWTNEEQRVFHQSQALESMQSQAEVLGKFLSAHQYEGYFGIDAYFYHDEQDELKFHSFSELNPRMTMGLMAHSWHKNFCHHQSLCEIRILPSAIVQEQELIATFNHAGKLTEAYLPLNSAQSPHKFTPVLIVKS